jgi:hypothetical protein
MNIGLLTSGYLSNMQMILAVGKDINDQLTSLYVGYDFQAAQAAVTAANPAIGYIFRDPVAATVAIRATPPAAPPPAITTLTPATGPANTDITVDITGTGFDSGATVNIGTAHSIAPSNITPTDITVLIKAVNIAAAGTLAVSVTNGDGQVSNALDFTAT